MGARRASGPGDRRSAPGFPSPGEAARARRAALAPPSGPSPKCFRTCHLPLHFPLPTWTRDPREERARGQTGGAGAAGRGLTAGAHRGPGVPQPHAPWPAPASPAAIVPAPPPPAARPPPPRAPAPTPGRGSRLRRRRRWRRHNNINTAGPPATPALRRPLHSPRNAANGDRKARRRDWRRPGCRHGRYPGLLAAPRSRPRRPASAAPLSNRDAGRHRARPPTSSRRTPPPRLRNSPRGGAAPGPGLRGRGPQPGGGATIGAGRARGGRLEAGLRGELQRAKCEGRVGEPVGAGPCSWHVAACGQNSQLFGRGRSTGGSQSLRGCSPQGLKVRGA